MRVARRRLLGRIVECVRDVLYSVSLISVDLPEPDTPGDAGEQAERDVDGDVLRLLPRASTILSMRCGSLARVAPALRSVRPRQVPAGQRARDSLDIRGRPLGDDPPAMDAGARAEVDDVVGAADRVLVVLDDDDGVAEVAQPHQRIEQALIIPLVQADRRLVEDVHHADQPRADLAREADALRLAARQRLGAAVEGQVVEADVGEKAEAVADLLDDLTAIAPRQPGSSSVRKKSSALPTDRPVTCAMLSAGDEHVPRRVLSRVPPQSGHGLLPRYLASSSRTIIESVSR